MLVLSDSIFNIGMSLSLFVEASVQQFFAVKDHLLQIKQQSLWIIEIMSFQRVMHVTLASPLGLITGLTTETYQGIQRD